MKKLLFLGSACLFLAGGIKTAPATPLLLAQNPAPTTPTQPAQLQLLTPGTQPRQELRLKPQANTKQLMTITTNMDIANSLAGQATPKIKTPATVMKMEVLVTQVDGNGDIHSKFTYTEGDVVADASVAPEILEAVRSSIKKMVGLNGTLITDNRGQVKTSNITLPEDIDPMTKTFLTQLSNSFGQMSSPVPQEAVGVGAKWRVSNQLKISSINMNQNAIYELVSLKDNVATFNVTVEQQANAQDLTLPGIPAGSANVSLKSMSSQGQGQITLPLTSVMPSRSTMSMRSQNEMSIKEPNSGKEMTIGTQMSMQMNLESQFSN
jgi:Family of unknown function (DUF6263)